MSTKSSIEWTESTWNPLAGCRRVSPGCGGAKGQGGCYAEKMAKRQAHMELARGLKPGDPGAVYLNVVKLDDDGQPTAAWNGNVQLLPDRLWEPLSWRKPRRIFVNSMSDLFHDDVPDEYIAAVFGVMAACPQHTFQILTKRADRLPRWFAWAAEQKWVDDDGRTRTGAPRLHCCFEALRREALHVGDDGPLHTKRAADPDGPWPLPNVWLGVSVERPAEMHRIDDLRRTPAAVRFLSVEPQIEYIDLRGRLDGIHLAIVGGESGPGARPFDLEWARDIIAVCREAGAAAFFKQGGASNACAHSKKGGCLECMPADLRVREYPAGATP